MILVGSGRNTYSEHKMSAETREELCRDGVVSDPEFQQMVGIGRTEAYHLRKNNAIPFIRLGRRIMYPRRAVVKFLAERMVASA